MYRRSHNGTSQYAIMAAAIHDYILGMETAHELSIILFVSILSMCNFGLLTIFKFHYAIVLQSASLQKDGICSLIGTFLAMALFVNTLIIKNIPGAWWIDSAVAWVCGVTAICTGLNAIVEAVCLQKLPIWSLNWWYSSRGDGMDELEEMGELNEQQLGSEEYYTVVRQGLKHPINRGVI